jgi:acyl carrier protein
MISPVKIRLLERLASRLELFDISSSEISDDFDLVQSGLVNSMEFVELVAGLEEDFGVEIDYEKALEKDDFTTVGGIVRNFEK